MFGPIHHTGYVVTALEPAERQFAALGYERLLDPSDDPGYDVEILFLQRRGAQPGEPLIELIRPRSPQSATYAHTKESKLQIHHVCFVVEDISAAVPAARSAGMFQVGQVRPAPAIGGSAICFLFSRAVGLIELVERPPFPAIVTDGRDVSLAQT
jgi:hypothetical protein